MPWNQLYMWKLIWYFLAYMIFFHIGNRKLTQRPSTTLRRSSHSSYYCSSGPMIPGRPVIIGIETFPFSSPLCQPRLRATNGSNTLQALGIWRRSWFQPNIDQEDWIYLIMTNLVIDVQTTWIWLMLPVLRFLESEVWVYAKHKTTNQQLCVGEIWKMWKYYNSLCRSDTKASHFMHVEHQDRRLCVSLRTEVLFFLQNEYWNECPFTIWVFGVWTSSFCGTGQQTFGKDFHWSD